MPSSGVVDGEMWRQYSVTSLCMLVRVKCDGGTDQSPHSQCDRTEPVPVISVTQCILRDTTGRKRSGRSQAGPVRPLVRTPTAVRAQVIAICIIGWVGRRVGACAARYWRKQGRPPRSADTAPTSGRTFDFVSGLSDRIMARNDEYRGNDQ